MFSMGILIKPFESKILENKFSKKKSITLVSKVLTLESINIPQWDLHLDVVLVVGSTLSPNYLWEFCL